MIEESELVRIEKAFEESKGERLKARMALDASRGKYHTQLVARREAGENLTIKDMEALEDAAIDEISDINKAYLRFCEVDSQYRLAKVAWESAKRVYWSDKGR